MKNKIYLLSDVEFTQLVKQSTSYTAILRVCGYKVKQRQGGQIINVLKQRIQELNINVSHFKKNGWIDSDHIFNRGRATTQELKKALLREGKPYKCEICGRNLWNEKPLVLELDHIDGDSTNNKRENLRFLCPNCHSQTDTYKGRNINNGKHKVTDAQLVAAYKKESNIRKALIAVGLAPKGANYGRLQKLL